MRLPRLLAALVAVLMTGSALAAVHVAGHRRATALTHQAPTHQAIVLAAGTEGLSGVAAGGTAPNPGLFPQAPAATSPHASAGSGSDHPASSRLTHLPTPTTGDLPPVAPLRSVLEVDAVVMLPTSLTTGEEGRLRAIRGITAVATADTGTVTVAGDQAVTFGVDPSTFRAFTPEASATSTRLWQYLAGGALISSYDMATDTGLRLGSEVPVVADGAGAHAVPGWLGAFASIGLPGVDLLVDRSLSADLGLAPDTGLVVSAPSLAGAQLERQLRAALPGSAVELLRPDQMSGLLSGDTLSGSQRTAIIAAALSRVGDRYVWGGAGPSVFDCSGLVQWSFAQAGIAMPRTADEQYLTGIHIPLADAVPGDLLYWHNDPNDPGFIDHTAIYLGNGLMVEAPHTGLDVQVVPVYSTNFAGAMEVLLQQ